jgi:hypothetical protein
VDNRDRQSTSRNISSNTSYNISPRVQRNPRLFEISMNKFDFLGFSYINPRPLYYRGVLIPTLDHFLWYYRVGHECYSYFSSGLCNLRTFEDIEFYLRGINVPIRTYTMQDRIHAMFNFLFHSFRTDKGFCERCCLYLLEYDGFFYPINHPAFSHWGYIVTLVTVSIGCSYYRFDIMRDILRNETFVTYYNGIYNNNETLRPFFNEFQIKSIHELRSLVGQ